MNLRTGWIGAAAGLCIMVSLAATTIITREEFDTLAARVTKLEEAIALMNDKQRQLAPQSFLRDCSDEALRSELYRLYGSAEVEAKNFAAWGNWRPVVGVVVSTATQPAFWGPRAGGTVIGIHPDRSDRGALFHELFHGAFDHSPLQMKNDKWGEAFCNAFRYFMEARLCPDSTWLAEVNNRLAGGVNLAHTTPHPDLILLYCQRDYERFKAFWKERQTKSRESLDRFFSASAWPR